MNLNAVYQQPFFSKNIIEYARIPLALHEILTDNSAKAMIKEKKSPANQ